MQEGGFVGLIVNSSVQGRYLDSEEADDFFEMAAELGVPVFLHPGAEPVGSDNVRDFRLVEQVSRFFDVAVSLATLVVSGRLEQYPDLEADRRDGGRGHLADREPASTPRSARGPPAEGVVRAELSGDPSDYLRNVYVDTANQNPASHLANLELMGPERMLFGTDSPPLATPLEQAISMVRDLPIPEEAQDGILEGNARRLFALDGASIMISEALTPGRRPGDARRANHKE